MPVLPSYVPSSLSPPTVFTPPGMHTRCECVNTHDDRLCNDNCAIPSLTTTMWAQSTHATTKRAQSLHSDPGPEPLRDNDDAATAPARQRYGYTAPVR